MKKSDCFAVARIVTTAWNETYRSIVNDEFLDNLYLNEQERATNNSFRVALACLNDCFIGK